MSPEQAIEGAISEEIMEDIAEEILEDEELQDEPDEAAVAEESSEEEAGDEQEEQPLPELSQEEQLRLLEAILFATTEPLSAKAIHERLPEGADLGVLLPQLKETYTGRGVELVEIDGHWAFRTAQEIADSLTVEKEVNKKMSRAMLETMSIIAYHQPITRAEIENIRGVATHRGTLDTLMEVEWVKPGRRRETPGRPLTWVTTTKFLDHFQLENLNDLPGLEDLKASGLLDKRPAIETIPDTGDLFDSPDENPEEVLDAEERENQEEAFEDDFSGDMIGGSRNSDEEEE